MNTKTSSELFHSQRRAQKFFLGEGVGGFSKQCENFVDLFFKSINLMFRALRKYYKDLFLAKLFCTAGNYFKQQKIVYKIWEHSQTFSKSANIINFERGTRAEKAQLFSQNFPKKAKKPLGDNS